MLYRVLLVSAALLLLPAPATAQQTESDDGISFNVTGGLQSRITYGQTSVDDDAVDRIGLGVRRGRIDFNVTLNNRLGINYDVDLARGNVATIDIFGFYNINNNLQLRAGLFTPAQPRAYIFTSFTRLDGLERPAIAENWAMSGIGLSGRDFGVDLTIKQNKTSVIVGIHNGSGNFATENVNQSILLFNNRESRSLGEMAVSTYLNHEIMPGLEAGGYASYNGAQTRTTATTAGTPGRNYVGWSTHLYWGPHPGDQPLRLKLELIGMHFQSSTQPNNAADVLGVSGTFAVQAFDYGEFYTCVEHLDAALDQSFLSVGFSYSLSARNGGSYHKNRLTLGYQQNFNTDAALVEKHLLVLQSQIIF